MKRYPTLENTNSDHFNIRNLNSTSSIFKAK